jgi:hypothetical protein
MSVRFYPHVNGWVHPSLYIAPTWIKVKTTKRHRARYRAYGRKLKASNNKSRKVIQMALTTTLPGVPAQNSGKYYAGYSLPDAIGSWQTNGASISADGLTQKITYTYKDGADSKYASVLTITRTYNRKLDKTFATFRLTAETKTVSSLSDDVTSQKLAVGMSIEYDGDTLDPLFIGRMASVVFGAIAGTPDGTTGIPGYEPLTNLNYGAVAAT